MKRLMVILTALYLGGFAIDRLLNHVAADAEGRGGAVPISGDANGDGKLNIADAVYIINNQFRGGPAPVPIACPPAALPATGQTTCYGYMGGQGWVTVPCDNAEYPGQDGFHRAGCPSEGRLLDNGDGTVTDTCTGLVWQKNTADVNGDGQITDASDGGDRVTWEDALKYCDSLSFAGHDDWRLPNVRELQSIVDYGQSAPATDPVLGAVSVYYWSSSVVATVPGYSWVVHFGVGYVNGIDGRGERFHVRAVRGGP